MMANWCWWVTLISFISSFRGHICWPTLQPPPLKDVKQQVDSEESRRVLGSSVVTSVSVITDHGNGTKTYLTDGFDNSELKSNIIGSPGNLMNPDRYEFYTFDETGDLIKRLMTWDEIQGLIAGDGLLADASLPIYYNDGFLEKSGAETPHIPANEFQTSDIQGVHKVVESVQNVLKSELAASQGKVPNRVKPEFLSNAPSWTLFLPGLFDDTSGSDFNHLPNFAQSESIVPEKGYSYISAKNKTTSTTPGITKEHYKKTEKPNRFKTTTLKPSITSKIDLENSNQTSLSTDKYGNKYASSLAFDNKYSTGPPVYDNFKTSYPTNVKHSSEQTSSPSVIYSTTPENTLSPLFSKYSVASEPSSSTSPTSQLTVSSSSSLQQFSPNSSTSLSPLPVSSSSEKYWISQSSKNSSTIPTPAAAMFQDYPIKQSTFVKHPTSTITSTFNRYPSFHSPPPSTIDNLTPISTFNKYSTSSFTKPEKHSFSTLKPSTSTPIHTATSAKHTWSSIIPTTKMYSTSSTVIKPSTNLNEDLQSSFSNVLNQVTDQSNNLLQFSEKPDLLSNEQKPTSNNRDQVSEFTTLKTYISNSSTAVQSVMHREKITPTSNKYEFLVRNSISTTTTENPTKFWKTGSPVRNISTFINYDSYYNNYKPSTENTTLISSNSTSNKKPLAPFTMKPQSKPAKNHTTSHRPFSTSPINNYPSPTGTIKHTTQIPTKFEQFSSYYSNQKLTQTNRFTTGSKTSTNQYHFPLSNKTYSDSDKLITEQYVSHKITPAPQFTKYYSTEISKYSSPGFTKYNSPGFTKYNFSLSVKNTSPESATSRPLRYTTTEFTGKNTTRDVAASSIFGNNSWTSSSRVTDKPIVRVSNDSVESPTYPIKVTYTPNFATSTSSSKFPDGATISATNATNGSPGEKITKENYYTNSDKFWTTSPSMLTFVQKTTEPDNATKTTYYSKITHSSEKRPSISYTTGDLYSTISDTLLQKVPTINPPSKSTVTSPGNLINKLNAVTKPNLDYENMTQISVMMNRQNDTTSQFKTQSIDRVTINARVTTIPTVSTGEPSNAPSVMNYEKIYSSNGNIIGEDNFIQNGISAVTNILLQTESRISNKEEIESSLFNVSDTIPNTKLISTTESVFDTGNSTNGSNSAGSVRNNITISADVVKTPVDKSSSTSKSTQSSPLTSEQLPLSTGKLHSSTEQLVSSIHLSTGSSNVENEFFEFTTSSVAPTDLYNANKTVGTTVDMTTTDIYEELYTFMTIDPSNNNTDNITETTNANAGAFYIPVNIINVNNITDNSTSIASTINVTTESSRENAAENKGQHIENESSISMKNHSISKNSKTGATAVNNTEMSFIYNTTSLGSNNDSDTDQVIKVNQITTNNSQMNQVKDQIPIKINSNENASSSTDEESTDFVKISSSTTEKSFDLSDEITAPVPTSVFRVPGNFPIRPVSSAPTHSHPVVDLPSAPHEHMGLEATTAFLSDDIRRFVELCNELSFKIWTSCTGKDFVNLRSLVLSPFSVISTLAMIFLGARGSSSGQMNDFLRLDDMVTFNPHQVLQNITESIINSRNIGVANAAFVREIYSDKSKGKILDFYKERVEQYYDGHVEEINFNSIGDLVRRRTNLLIKRQTSGRIPDYLRGSSLVLKPPLASLTANIFQTDCDLGSTEGRDGEMYFVVRPSNRQRRLVPIPAVVYRSGFLAGYEPGLDATAVTLAPESIVSTILILPGQQGQVAPGDGLVRLEQRLLEAYYRRGSWSRLLRSLLHRPGLELQMPRFSHKSVLNLTSGLERIGLREIFSPEKADLKGINGRPNDLYLSDVLQVNTFSTCGEDVVGARHHIETYPSSPQRVGRLSRSLDDDDINSLYYTSIPLNLRPRQARLPDTPRLRYDRPFLYIIRHNPTGMILYIGRFNPRLIP